jgi:hypothetical protein
VIGVIAVFFKYLSAFLSRRPGNQGVINHPVITPAEKREKPMFMRIFNICYPDHPI